MSTDANGSAEQWKPVPESSRGGEPCPERAKNMDSGFKQVGCDPSSPRPTAGCSLFLSVLVLGPP